MASLIFLGKENWFHYVLQTGLDEKDPDSPGIIGEALCSYLEKVIMQTISNDAELILQSLEMIGINPSAESDLVSTTAWWFRDVRNMVEPILIPLMPPYGKLELSPIIWWFPEGPALHAIACNKNEY